MDTTAERIAVLEEQVRAFRVDLADLLSQISGPPWERSLRGRVHNLEAESTAATIAARALAEAQAEHRRARQEREAAQESVWSWRWKLLGALTAVALAVAPYVQMIYG